MFELNIKYTFQTPAGAISQTGIDLIKRCIESQRLREGEWLEKNPDNQKIMLPQLPDDWQWLWLIARGEYQGTFPKRVARYYHRTYALRCPNVFVTELGNLARQHSDGGQTYVFEFVNRIDWQAGDFGDPGSCYWGENAGARLMLEANGGLAIRFYSGTGRYGFARAWLVGIDDRLWVIFNGYGMTTLHIARIFSLFVGFPYKWIRLSNYDGNTLYINGSYGYLIGAWDVIEGIDRHEFEWDDIIGEACYSCGRILDEYEGYNGADDRSYCEDCHYRLFTRCDYCSETFWRDTHDVEYLEHVGMDVCEHCRENHFAQCPRCEEWYYRRYTEMVGLVRFCHDCAAELRLLGDNIE